MAYAVGADLIHQDRHADLALCGGLAADAVGAGDRVDRRVNGSFAPRTKLYRLANLCNQSRDIIWDASLSRASY
jgi:hypothetical protein